MADPSYDSHPPSAADLTRKKLGRLTLWPLVAATFFMVSGGTYGIEDIVHGGGYGRAILLLAITPLLWSLPAAFMIGELSSALPCEGGFYAWVRRAMGNFWGFQEAWLSLMASIFDMAIYPTLFVLYLTRMFPWFAEGHHGIWVGLVVVIACTVLNILGGYKRFPILPCGCSFCCPHPLCYWCCWRRSATRDSCTRSPRPLLQEST